MAERTDVAIVGGGSAGLATAATCGRAGLRAVVLEAGAEPGCAWRARYDRLHLHTPRLLSGLPGYGIPRRYGRWLPRDSVVEYLGEYARHHELDVRLGTRVERLDPDHGGWAVTTAGGERLHARHVVVATGYSNVPRLPKWPGRDGFRSELLHSSVYRNAGPFRGRDVLVVGSGNSGAEIAVDLAESGAGRVRIAVRTPPHITKRAALGIPAQAIGIALSHLPPVWAGRVSSALRRLTIPDLSSRGLPRPPQRLGVQFARTGTIPILDVGFVDAVRHARIEVVAAVESLDGDEVVLADGARVRPDVVLAATGFRPGLEPLVGHLDVLDERGLPREQGLPSGLHFIGLRPTLGGMLRRASIESRALAQRIAAEEVDDLGVAAATPSV